MFFRLSIRHTHTEACSTRLSQKLVSAEVCLLQLRPSEMHCFSAVISASNLDLSCFLHVPPSYLPPTYFLLASYLLPTCFLLLPAFFLLASYLLPAFFLLASYLLPIASYCFLLSSYFLGPTQLNKIPLRIIIVQHPCSYPCITKNSPKWYLEYMKSFTYCTNMSTSKFILLLFQLISLCMVGCFLYCSS